MADDYVPNPPTRDRPIVPPKRLRTDYPMIDSDPHFKRVVRYARPTDWAYGGVLAAGTPGMLWLMERVSPTYMSRGSFPPMARLAGFVGLGGGFLLAYTRTCMRFYGAAENTREIEMDMREMVDKVKQGEPLYGKSSMTEYMQGIASRNSRYLGFWTHVIPWPNFVNHNQHGVDTAKYYQQAERELEAERVAREGK